MYWSRIYGYSLAYIKSVPQVEELTQDVFMDIWNNRKKLPSIENFANYLFIVTRNRVFKVLRKKLEGIVDVNNIQLKEDIWLPGQQIELKEAYTLVLTGIEKMPPVRKRVFTMSRLEGKSYEQIGLELNLSRNTVKEHIVKALNFIRNHLAAQGHSFIFIVACLLQDVINNL